MSMKKTKFYNNVDSKWLLVDAKDQVLGRLSVHIARYLMGKNKAQFTPNFVCGEKVVVINAKHIKVTGKKFEDKIYKRFSGYPSGDRSLTYRQLQEKNPCKALEHSIRGMLPKNWVGKQVMRNLKVFAENAHDHAAQKPQILEVK